MSSLSAPPSTDADPPAPLPEPPGRPRHVAAAWPVWRERFVGAAFLGAGVGLWLAGGRLTAAQQAVLWAALLLALALVVVRGWLPLLGPVFGCDLVRTTRRGRYAALRAVYAVALLLFIIATYRAQPALDSNPWGAGTGGMARFAETFCYTFLAVQFLAVAALTPAYVAGAIAEEKDRKTLEFLLATDLRDREIVLGKVASRVANLGLFVLTGLPVLSLTQLWGGVDFGLLLAAFANTALTLLSLAAVSILASVYSRTAREAVVLAYLVGAAYVGLSVLVHLLVFFPRVLALPLTPGGGPYAVPLAVADDVILVRLPLTAPGSPYTVQHVVEAFTAGNPILFCLGLREDLRTGMTLQDSLAARTETYVAFHLLVAVAFTSWAVLRLRPLALLDGPVKVKPLPAERRWRLGWRPRPGRRALLWKEVWAERGLSFNWFGKGVILLIVLASLIPAVWLIGDFLLDISRKGYFDENGLARAVNVWVRLVGTMVACLTLLGVAVRAASSISGEHDRQTFDSLLTAPVESTSILFAKWLGSILSVRWAWVWLLLVWLLGAATDGVYLPAISWLVLAWGVYAGFLAVVGLWFSMSCRTTLRATVWTLVTAVVLGVGHWYLWMVFCLPLRLREETFAGVVRFQMYGLTPPMALYWLAFRGGDVQSGLVGTRGDPAEDALGALLCFAGGLVLWAIAGAVLWWRACRRFAVLTGRAPIPVPAGGPMAGLAAPPGEMEAAPARRRPLRWRRVLVALPAAGVLAAVGWAVYLAVSADRHLEAALEGLDRDDPDWRLAEIEAARPPLAADQNSGPLVLAVRGTLPPWNVWPTSLVAGQFDELAPPLRPTADQRRALIDDLEAVEESLALVAPLADMPRGRYTIAWNRNYLTIPLRHVDAYHGVRQLLWYDLVVRADDGDPDGALGDCVRLLNLGRSLGDEPMMISQVVRMNAARTAARGAQRVLAQGEPGEAALADLRRRFTDEEAHPGLVIGLRGDRAGVDNFMGLVQAGEFPWQELARFADPQERTGHETLDQLLFSVTPGAEKESRAALLRHLTDLIAAARLPAEEQGPAFDRAEARRLQLPLVARQLSVRGVTVSRRNREGRAELRCAALALAAEQFRRRLGRWPERLDELTPDFLTKVPTDPFGGAALRLRRLPDGLVIYSVGPDGTDDGGDVRDTANLNRPGKDCGFRLWDVPERRRAQPPAAGPPG
jgi:ABC-type transport system involved in multi-copper enzyme maturation permease subunit